MINVSPRLAAQAAGPVCGKTVAMEAISNLVPRPLSASSITPAVVFRIIEEVQPTLLLDEADQMLADRSSPLVAILNSSHRKSSAFVWLTVEGLPGQHVPTQFSTWAAVMFAGIHKLPPTLQDRSIVLLLRRAKPGEVQQHLRDGKCAALAKCGQKLARWAADLIELPDLKLPVELSNRLGDNWRPLLAIAELAGDGWPARAFAAAQVAIEHQEKGKISNLLRDIAQVFGEREKILSAELVGGLIKLDETPYSELNRGKPITPHWLARQLKGVVSGSTSSMSNGEKRAKGYSLDMFTDAWEQYGTLTDSEASVSKTAPKTTVPTVTTGQPLSSNGYSVTDGSRMDTDVTEAAPDVTEASRLPDALKPIATAVCHGVTDDTVGLGGISEASPEEPVSTVQEEDDTCLI